MTHDCSSLGSMEASVMPSAQKAVAASSCVFCVQHFSKWLPIKIICKTKHFTPYYLFVEKVFVLHTVATVPFASGTEKSLKNMMSQNYIFLTFNIVLSWPTTTNVSSDFYQLLKLSL